MSTYRGVKAADKRKDELGNLGLRDLRNAIMRGKKLRPVRDRIEHQREHPERERPVYTHVEGLVAVSDTGTIKVDKGVGSIFGGPGKLIDDGREFATADLNRAFSQAEGLHFMGEIDIQELSEFIDDILERIAASKKGAE